MTGRWIIAALPRNAMHRSKKKKKKAYARLILILVLHKKGLLGDVLIPYTSCICQVHFFSLITLITVQRKAGHVMACGNQLQLDTSKFSEAGCLIIKLLHHLYWTFVLKGPKKCTPLRSFVFTCIYFILVSFIQLVFDASCNFGEREHS